MNYETTISGYETMTPLEDETAARKRRAIWIAALAILVAVLVGYTLYSGTSASDAPAAGTGKGAPTVTVIIPGRQLVQGSVSATGTLAARREMPVGAVGEGGMISRVWVEPGSWVQAGQVLASVERSVQVQQTSQLVAQIAASEADARLAQNDLDRAQALAGRGFVSKAEIDRKTAQRDAARARVRVVQAQLGENRARIGRLDIRAPASGLVLARNVEPGQVIGAGSGVLFRIAKGGEMEMKAQLGEADLARMSVGLSAVVTPVGSGKAFEGQIWQILPVIDPQSRQGTARIALGYDAALRPGGFASVDIKSGTAEAPVLPESAVLSDSRGNYVYVVGGDKKVVRRDVKAGAVTDKGVTIAAGLQGNEQVVESAGGFLNPGEAIIPKLAKSSK